jgi:proteic killer suppression protein
LIISFSDQATEDLYHGYKTARVRRFPQDIIPSALRKLDMLARAHAIMDLRAPPGNRLEALKGGLEGYFSIRINDQWRVIFQWDGHDAREVAIVDYHS